jgi:hypothetical protein
MGLGGSSRAQSDFRPEKEGTDRGSVCLRKEFNGVGSDMWGNRVHTQRDETVLEGLGIEKEISSTTASTGVSLGEGGGISLSGVITKGNEGGNNKGSGEVGDQTAEFSIHGREEKDNQREEEKIQKDSGLSTVKQRAGSDSFSHG